MVLKLAALVSTVSTYTQISGTSGSLERERDQSPSYGTFGKPRVHVRKILVVEVVERRYRLVEISRMSAGLNFGVAFYSFLSKASMCVSSNQTHKITLPNLSQLKRHCKMHTPPSEISYLPSEFALTARWLLVACL